MMYVEDVRLNGFFCTETRSDIRAFVRLTELIWQKLFLKNKLEVIFRGDLEKHKRGNKLPRNPHICSEFIDDTIAVTAH